MKYITILILFLTLTVNAAKYKVSVSNYDKQDVDSTLASLMNDLKYFLDEPLHWCEVKPTDYFEVIEQGPIYTRVQVQVEANCNESVARRKFMEFWIKYDKFLYEYGNRVDAMIENIYPDYKLYWGIAINSYNFIQLKIQPDFGGTNSSSEKVLFFRLKLNDEYLTDPMQLSMPGSLLNTIPTSTIPEIFNRQEYYQLVIPTKLLQSGELGIDIQRQWHLASREKFIKRYR